MLGYGRCHFTFNNRLTGKKKGEPDKKILKKGLSWKRNPETNRFILVEPIRQRRQGLLCKTRSIDSGDVSNFTVIDLSDKALKSANNLENAHLRHFFRFSFKNSTDFIFLRIYYDHGGGI